MQSTARDEHLTARRRTWLPFERVQLRLLTEWVAAAAVNAAAVQRAGVWAPRVSSHAPSAARARGTAWLHLGLTSHVALEQAAPLGTETSDVLEDRHHHPHRQRILGAHSLTQLSEHTQATASLDELDVSAALERLPQLPGARAPGGGWSAAAEPLRSHLWQLLQLPQQAGQLARYQLLDSGGLRWVMWTVREVPCHGSAALLTLLQAQLNEVIQSETRAAVRPGVPLRVEEQADAASDILPAAAAAHGLDIGVSAGGDFVALVAQRALLWPTAPPPAAGAAAQSAATGQAGGQRGWSETLWAMFVASGVEAALAQFCFRPVSWRLGYLPPHISVSVLYTLARVELKRGQVTQGEPVRAWAKALACEVVAEMDLSRFEPRELAVVQWACAALGCPGPVKV